MNHSRLWLVGDVFLREEEGCNVRNLWGSRAVGFNGG